MQDDLIIGSKENKVTIYGWNSAIAGGHSVGHIAIQLPYPDSYISLCPKTGAKKLLTKGIFAPIKHYFHDSYIEDKETCEEREPEFIKHLYCLDTKAMKEYLDEIKPNIKGWSMLGGKIKSDIECCTTIAYKILLKGDVNGYIKNNSFSEYSSSILPDRLIETINRTVIQERKDNAEILSYDNTDEKGYLNTSLNNN